MFRPLPYGRDATEPHSAPLLIKRVWGAGFWPKLLGNGAEGKWLLHGCHQVDQATAVLVSDVFLASSSSFLEDLPELGEDRVRFLEQGYCYWR